MVFDWLWKRILSEKNLGFAYQKLRPVLIADMASNLKMSLISVLEDEELAAALADYGDALVKGRLQVVYSSLGGKQKGLNFALQGESILDQLVDEEGRPNLAGILKAVFSGGLRNVLGGSGGSPPRSYGEKRDISRI
jgi:hypothetical protein